MTIAELYNYAKTHNIENLPIFVHYSCDDDWYSFDEKLTEKNIELENGDIYFNFY